MDECVAVAVAEAVAVAVTEAVAEADQSIHDQSIHDPSIHPQSILSVCTMYIFPAYTMHIFPVCTMQNAQFFPSKEHFVRKRGQNNLLERILETVRLRISLAVIWH